MPTLLLLAAACHSIPQRDQVQYLRQHPQYQAVRQAAPQWGKEALTIINDQQREIQKLRADQ